MNAYLWTMTIFWMVRWVQLVNTHDGSKGHSLAILVVTAFSAWPAILLNAPK